MQWNKILGWAIVIGIIGAIAIYFIITDIVLKIHDKHRPNIIVIIADDLGFNDVSFHGSHEIPTPNIDALAYNGIILDKFYTQPACSPSRTAFLTGNYPIRSGMQGGSLNIGEDINLPVDMEIMPELLKKLGYKNHLVGKWHLGYSRKENTPTLRGFDSFTGYWNGHTDYFNYTSRYENVLGFDLHDGLSPSWKDKGKYAPDLFTNIAIDIIEKDDHLYPLFLVVSHLAAHVGEGDELGVLNITETQSRYKYIKDPRRQRYAEVVRKLDESVGKIIKKLSDRDMLKNSIIVFFSDNGGATIGSHNNTGSNWPLRGMKSTYFEGGVRGTGIIFSPLFEKKSYVNKNLIHLVDLLPTLYAGAGGNIRDLGQIDGIDQWEALSDNKTGVRTEVLIGVDEVRNSSSILGINGTFKFISGNFDNLTSKINKSSHLGERGDYEGVPFLNLSEVIASPTNLAIVKISGYYLTPEKVTEKHGHLRQLSSCQRPNNGTTLDCSITGCLFDLQNDPCESKNIISNNTEIATELKNKIKEIIKAGMVLQKKRLQIDDKVNPKYYNYTFCTWLDAEECPKTNLTTNLGY